MHKNSKRTFHYSYSRYGFFSLSSPAGSQTKKPATLAELAAYMGADREQLLLAGARVEGKSFGTHH